MHEVHDGYPAALREHPAADARVVEGLPGVVLLVVRLKVCGYCDALGAAHEADEAGDEVIDVERARAGLHRAGLGLAHLGHGHEKVGVQGRFCCALDCACNLRTRRGVVGGRRTLVEERVRLFDLFYQLLRCEVSCMTLCIFRTRWCSLCSGSAVMYRTFGSGLVEAAISSAQVALLFWVLVWVIDVAIDLRFSRHCGGKCIYIELISAPIIKEKEEDGREAEGARMSRTGDERRVARVATRSWRVSRMT